MCIALELGVDLTHQYANVIPENERTDTLQACLTLLVNKKYASPVPIPPPIPFKKELRKQGIDPRSFPKRLTYRHGNIEENFDVSIK